MIVVGLEFGIPTYVYQIEMEVDVFATIFPKFGLLFVRLCCAVTVTCFFSFFSSRVCAAYDGSELGLVAIDCLMVYLIVNGDKFDGLWCNIIQYMYDNYLSNSTFSQTFKNFKNKKQTLCLKKTCICVKMMYIFDCIICFFVLVIKISCNVVVLTYFCLHFDLIVVFLCCLFCLSWK